VCTSLSPHSQSRSASSNESSALICDLRQPPFWGWSPGQILRKHGISQATYYNWKLKYGGTSVAELKRLKELEAENAKLKRIYADLDLENAAIRDVLARSSDAGRQARSDSDHGRGTGSR